MKPTAPEETHRPWAPGRQGAQTIRNSGIGTAQQHLGLCMNIVDHSDSASNPALQSEAPWFWAVLWVFPTPAFMLRSQLDLPIPWGSQMDPSLLADHPHFLRLFPSGLGCQALTSLLPPDPLQSDCGLMLNSVPSQIKYPGCNPSRGSMSLCAPTFWALSSC